MDEKTKIATPAAHSKKAEEAATYEAMRLYYIAQLQKPTANPAHPLYSDFYARD